MGKSSKKSKQKEEKETPSPKQEKLFQNLLKITKQFMSGKSFTPLTLEELMQRLSLPPQHQEILQQVLEHLLHSHLITSVKGHYTWKPPQTDLMTGIMRMHPRGFGFVQPHLPSLYPQDIFIPKHLTKNAIDGDEVEVLINQEAISEKGPEGKVTAILSRSRTHLAGIIRYIDRHEQLIAYAPLLGSQQRVVVEPSLEQPLHVGDRIVMEVKEWGTKETETHCRFSHHLGSISDPSSDISAAIEEFEIRADFPHPVFQEAEQLGKQVSRKDLQGREDLRSLTCFTIDPDTAKDFDDALSLTRDESGIYHLGVHIADVSHYVKLGSPLDEEAAKRCNSTYFPGICIPMLPPPLSENLCSLKPHVNRLTASVLMRLDEEGTLLDYEIKRSLIKSAKRFTYAEAKKVLDGKKKSRHAATLHLMVDLCQRLKKKRYERGSLEFSLPELVILVNEKGVPYQTSSITYDITHQMVEEFMLKANEVVAWDITLKGKPLTYRVHDEPAEENLRDFSLLASAFGFRLPDLPSPQDLQKLFEEAGKSPYANYLASSYIRRMRLALYSAENIGHYGLSLLHYCHFTSPIRRYIDLVIHRILFGEAHELEYLQQVANRCSEQERISAKAENSVLTIKKLRLLQQKKKENANKEYVAIITRVKNFGIYFEVIDLLLEGFIHISDLEEDYFVFDEMRLRLRGSHTGSIYASGDQLTLMLKEVDLISQEAKWVLVSKESALPSASKKDSSQIPGKRLFKNQRKKENRRHKKIYKDKK